MKHLFRSLSLLVFATSFLATSAESQQIILNRYLGNWTSNVVLKPSLWVPETKKFVEINNVQWILEGHYLQDITSFDGKEKTLTLRRYSQQKNTFELWDFKPADSSYWVGSWNKKSRTMTWKYIDFGIGIRGKLEDQFISDEKWVSKVVMEDKNGNLLLDAQVEYQKTNKSDFSKPFQKNKIF